MVRRKRYGGPENTSVRRPIDWIDCPIADPVRQDSPFPLGRPSPSPVARGPYRHLAAAWLVLIAGLALAKSAEAQNTRTLMSTLNDTPTGATAPATGSGADSQGTWR